MVLLSGALLQGLPIVVTAYKPAQATVVGQPVRIVEANVFFRNADFLRIGTFLEESKADIVVLEEFSSDHLDSLIPTTPSFSYRISTPDSDHYGVVLLSRWPISASRVIPLGNGSANAIAATIETVGGRIEVYGAHLHWPMTATSSRLRNLELQELATIVSKCAQPCVLLGDFNMTQWSYHYGVFLARSGMNDCTAGLGFPTTWPTGVWPLRIRIDQCFAGKGITTTNIEVGRSIGSDHYPTVNDFVLRQPDKK